METHYSTTPALLFWDHVYSMAALKPRVRVGIELN